MKQSCLRGFLLLVLFPFGLVSTLTAQDVIEEPEPLVPIRMLIDQPFDVRTQSLGSATFADPRVLSPMGINASLLALREPDITVQFNANHQWKNNQMTSHVTLPVLAVGSHRIAGRFGLSHEGSSTFNYLGPPATDMSDLQYYMADVAYAYRFSSAFSMGMLNRVVQLNGTESERLLYAVDLGLVYAPQGKITYGIIARGIGRQGTYSTAPTGDVEIGSTAQEVGIEVGANFTFPNPDEPYLSLSLSNEKRLYEDGLWYKGGVEVLPIPMIALRSGVQVHFGQSIAIPRYGLGFHLGGIHLDYMVSPHVKGGSQFHQLGVTLEF